MSAMSDELEKPPDEEEKDMETVSEDAPEKEAESPAKDTSEPDEEDSTITAEELRAELGEIGSRVKTAGLNPLRKMVRSYVNNGLDAVDGLLSALEGDKRKKGD